MTYQKFPGVCVAAVAAAVLLTATIAQAGPPKRGARLTGTVKVESNITAPSEQTLTNTRTVNVLQLNPETREAFGTIVSQGTKSAPSHLVVEVTHMHATTNADGSNGAWVCGFLSGDSFGVDIEEQFGVVPVIMAVVDSGHPGGEGDAVGGITRLPEGAYPLLCNLVPLTSPDMEITRQSIVDDFNFVAGTSLTEEQILDERLSGNLKLHP